MTGLSKAWLGRFGEIGHPYTHPSSKQCNYSYIHPSTKQCDAAAGNHTHILDNLSGTLSASKGGTGVTSIAALKTALGITSGGAKIAYGSGTSLSGLSFTPYICIYTAAYSSSVKGYWTWIAIKGYDTSQRLQCATESNAGNIGYCKCIFDTNSVTIAAYNSNFRLFSYKPCIVAIGE